MPIYKKFLLTHKKAWIDIAKIRRTTETLVGRMKQYLGKYFQLLAVGSALQLEHATIRTYIINPMAYRDSNE